MTRRVLGLLVLALACAGTAASMPSAGLIPLAVPPAQSVAIEAVKLTGGTEPTVRLRAGATAMVAVKANGLFAVVVNRSGRGATVGLGSISGGTPKTIADIAKASAAARAGFSKSVGKLLGWNPLTSPSDLSAAGVTLRLYDSKHPGGRPLESALAIDAARDASQLLLGLSIALRGDLFKQLDEVSGCILGRVECGDYVFTFRG